MATTNTIDQSKSGNPPPFLSILPVELRLEIYKYLLDIHHHPDPFSGRTPNHHGILPSQTPPKPKNPPQPLLHPSILSTCRQIYHEALPILYTQNIFLANEFSLKSLPRLWIPPINSPHARPSNPITTSEHNISLIRRWCLRVRLDSRSPPWTAEDVTAAFSGTDELMIYPYRSIFIGGIGVDMLRKFEGVRGVKRMRILGCMVGFEGYVRWLEGVMMKPLGADDDTDSQEDGEDMASRYERQRQWELQWGDEPPTPPVEGKKKAIMLGGYRCVDELERKRLTGWACEAK